MDTTEKNTRDYYVVDLAHVIKAVWHRFWVVILVSLLTAGIGFSVASFVITPTYSSSVMLYVNNGSGLEDLGFSISSSELTAAQSLAKTYSVLLKNRTTLEQVIEQSGLDYKYEEVYYMVEASPVDETEVLQITVTHKNPKHAYLLAKSITEVLPVRVGDIVNDATMEVVDYPIVNKEKVYPSIPTYTALGFSVGALLSVVLLVILAMKDNTVHDEEFIIKNYDYPILAKIPSLASGSSKRYGYGGYRYGSYGSKGGNNNG